MATKTLDWGSSGCYSSSAQTADATISNSTGTSYTLSLGNKDLYWRKLFIDLKTVFGTTAVTINSITVNFKAYGSRSSSLYNKGTAITGWCTVSGANETISHNGTIGRQSWTTYSDIIEGSYFNSNHFTYNNMECIGVGIQIKNPNSTVSVDFNVKDISFVVDYTLPAHTILVKKEPTEGGTVSGGGTYDYGSSVSITATPNEGYVFTHWNDGNTNANRVIAVTKNAQYIAYFEKVKISKIRYGASTVNSVFDTNKNKAKSVWYGSTQIL